MPVEPVDPDERQRYMRERLPDDDLPIGMPLYRASKCDALCRAVGSGHDTYRPAMLDVSALLHAYTCRTGETADTIDHTVGGPSDIEAMWRRVDAWPWPPPGPPQAQPD